MIELSGFSENGSIPAAGHDLPSLYNNTYVQGLRNLYNADLVILLTHAAYYNPPTRGCAVEGPNNNLAYAIVEVPYAVTTFSLVHEFGHLLGCKHQRNSEPLGTINHGYSFMGGNDNNVYKTVMHTVLTSQETQRIPYFSNPAKFYAGVQMGRADSCNNALWIYQHAPSVSDFRTNQTNLYACINGPSHAGIGLNSTWSAYVLGGVGPYSFVWAWSSNGVNYNNLGTGPSITAQPPCSGFSFYIRVTVSSADNQTTSDFQQIWIDQPEPSNLITKDSDINQVITGTNESHLNTENNLTGRITIFPNPITESTVIRYTVVQPSTVEIKLTDLAGRVILTIVEERQEAGTYNKSLKTSSLSPGIYLCSLKIGHDKTIEKLIIQ